MTFKVVLSAEAQKFYMTAERSVAKKIAKCLLQLEHTPLYHPNIKSLTGKLAGYYRYRLGDYRVVYAVNEQSAVVEIVMIAHRKDAYT